jgi:hypothetical protein
MKTGEERCAGKVPSTPLTGGKKKKTKDPVGALAGVFKDDPTWDEFIEAMQRARAEEEALVEVPL